MKQFIQTPVVWLMTGIITGWAHFAPSLLAHVVWFLVMTGLLACVMSVSPKPGVGEPPPQEPANAE